MIQDRRGSKIFDSESPVIPTIDVMDFALSLRVNSTFLVAGDTRQEGPESWLVRTSLNLRIDAQGSYAFNPGGNANTPTSSCFADVFPIWEDDASDGVKAAAPAYTAVVGWDPLQIYITNIR